MILSISHTALYTDKFEETIKFYKNAFEMEELGRFTSGRRCCWLSVGKSVLEIFESEKLPEHGCFKHIAFSVDNVDLAYKKALSFGALPYVEAKNITLDLIRPKNLRIAFVKGVNNEDIELCEDLK